MEEIKPGEKEDGNRPKKRHKINRALEAEFTKANWVWKRYNREERTMKCLRSVTKTTTILEAEVTETNSALQSCIRKKMGLRTDITSAT
jgi:hypothetical protein